MGENDDQQILGCFLLLLAILMWLMGNISRNPAPYTKKRHNIFVFVKVSIANALVILLMTEFEVT